MNTARYSVKEGIVTCESKQLVVFKHTWVGSRYFLFSLWCFEGKMDSPGKAEGHANCQNVCMRRDV